MRKDAPSLGFFGATTAAYGEEGRRRKGKEEGKGKKWKEGDARNEKRQRGNISSIPATNSSKNGIGSNPKTSHTGLGRDNGKYTSNYREKKVTYIPAASGDGIIHKSYGKPNIKRK